MGDETPKSTTSPVHQLNPANFQCPVVEMFKKGAGRVKVNKSDQATMEAQGYTVCESPEKVAEEASVTNPKTVQPNPYKFEDHTASDLRAMLVQAGVPNAQTVSMSKPDMCAKLRELRFTPGTTES